MILLPDPGWLAIPPLLAESFAHLLTSLGAFL